MAMNEEMQSGNEALESSKEEMQSGNEGLSTVNNRLQDKIKEMRAANNDMANLLRSTDIAMLLLDAGLRIKLFTPAATQMFDLVATDVGRPIGLIVKRFADAEFIGDAQQVLQQLTPREKEVYAEAGRWCVRRITPYRTVDDRIDGVVITFVDVTEHKQATDAVVQRLAAVVEGSADAIFSIDLDGVIRTWNRGAERLYGYSRDEAVGQSVKMLVPEDRPDEWNHLMAALARGEHVEQLETERLHKDGRRVAVALTASPVWDNAGKVAFASAIARDVTDHRRAEEEMRRLTNELHTKVEELSTLLDILPAGVLIADSTCRRITGNRAFYEMIGLPLGANLSLTAEHPDFPPGTRIIREGRDLPPSEYPMQAASLTGSRILSFDHDVVFPDGRVVTLLANTAPLLDENGAVRGVVGAYMDVTERRRAVALLRKREASLTAILNAAADAIITIDNHGVVQSVNAAAEQMFGYTSAEMTGANVRMLMPSPYREEHDHYLAKYLRTGERHIIGIGRELEARRKDGSIFPVDLAISEVEPQKLFTGILRDVSRRKELEREVVEIASLQQRRIGQDLHDTVSQELAALNMLASDLVETLRSDPVNASQLAGRLVLGLRRSQRELRTVMHGLVPVSVDAEGLMAALSDLAERIQRDDNAACIFDCPNPVLVEDNLIATHLYLIAQEAVHNAVKHARCQSIRISVKSDQLLILRVQDDGVGISDQPTNNHGGLGLRIMRNRAAIIGAALAIEQANPTGTVVTCTLVRAKHEPTK